MNLKKIVFTLLIIFLIPTLVAAQKVLDINNCEDEIYIYKPDLKTLRNKLQTTTQYIFLVR